MMNTTAYSYDRKTVQAGILHIGVGNFHRAHLAFYTDQLLKDEDQHNWGIAGVCLLPSDEKIFKNLSAQNLDYTLTVCGRDGNDEIYQIGALQELYWATENAEAVLQKIADPAIKIITLTITEGGYNLDKATNEFMLDDDKIKHDLENPQHPTTVFGFISEGLRRRRNKGNGSVTILSCDNLQHNGDTAKRAFSTFITAQDKDLADWIDTHVTFPNSMVDRITPATTKGLGKYTSKASGVFISAVFGGAVFTLIQGGLADIFGSWRWTWWLSVACELLMLSYALFGSKIRKQDMLADTATDTVVGSGH